MSKNKKQKLNSNENSYEGRVGLVYARVSSKRQQVEGTGLESQEGRCISELNSIKVPYIKTFPDSFSGGGDFMKRPAMRELLAYIDANAHKSFVVVFDDLKRFARDVEFHLKLRTAFKIRNVLLKCLNYNFDESPEGRFSELIMAGQAELERHQNRRQVIQKQKARLEAGYWAFGARKGFKMVKHPMHGMLLTPKDGEADLLRTVLEGFSTGKFVRRIDCCKFLAENGFWGKNPQAPEKYLDKFQSIITDPLYAGYIQYLPWEVERRKGHHQGIISIETFEINQKRLGKDGLSKRIRIDTSEDFPARGLILCDACGGHITGGWTTKRNGSRFAYYKCQNKKCITYGKSITKKDFETQLDDVIRSQTIKGNVDVLVGRVFEKVWSEEVNEIEKNEALKGKKQAELEEKLRQLTLLVLNTKVPAVRSVYEKQIEEIAQEIDTEGGVMTAVDLSTPYQTALSKAVCLLKNPYSYWSKLGVLEKQSTFFFIFEGKLFYSIKDGYQTAKTPCATRLFEDFVGVNTLDVDRVANLSNQFIEMWEFVQRWNNVLETSSVS